MFKIQYNFSAKLWQYSGKGAWIFVTLPEDISKEIRDNLKWQEEGWGRLKAKAKIGKSEWETAIWFDTKVNCYLLPLKSLIRQREAIEEGQLIEVMIWL